MSKLHYYEQLRSPLWQRKKNGILERDKYTCQCCGEVVDTLHVHHLTYEKGKMAWEYPDENLITLCEKCHSKIHSDGEWHEMPEVKIGDVFEYDHSDFTNYVICYHIDHLNGKVYLVGLDNGGSYDTLWFDRFTYDEFLYKCIKIDDWFSDENMEEGYFPPLLFACLYYYSNGEEKVHTYDEKEGDKNLFLCNLKEMLSNNIDLRKWFNKADNDKCIVKSIWR